MIGSWGIELYFADQIFFFPTSLFNFRKNFSETLDSQKGTKDNMMTMHVFSSQLHK